MHSTSSPLPTRDTTAQPQEAMSDAWFAEKLAPDGDTADGCHPEEAGALRAYLEGRLTAEEAARAMVRPVATSPDPQDGLPRLYALLMDALLELPAPTTAPLLALLGAVEAQPAPDFARVAEAQRPPHGTLWRGLPGFGHFWADGVVAERQRLEAKDGRGGDDDDEGLVARCARQAEVEAWLVRRGLAGLDLGWGYECVVAALERRRAPLHAAVPMACAWLAVAVAQFREGAAKREHSWALERAGDLWQSEAETQGEDPYIMSPARWDFWIHRLRTIADDDEVSPWARDAARQCVGTLQ